MDDRPPDLSLPDPGTGNADLWAMLQTAFRQTPLAMLLVSAPDGRIRMANPELVRILGVEDESAPPDASLLAGFRPSWQLLDASGVRLPWEEHPVRRAIRGETTRGAEYVVVRKDGTRRLIVVDASPVRNGAGDLVAAVLSFADITSAREAQQRLAQSEERYRMLVDQAADAILVGGPGGLIVEANLRAEAITGYARDELIGSNIASLFPPSVLNATPLRYDLLDVGVHVVRERDLRRRDGSLVPIEMSTVKVPDGRYQAILRDVSVRRRAEEEARKSLHFFESMERVWGAVAHTLDVEEALRGVLGLLPEILDCDRAWLLHPCRPDLPSWRVEMTVDRPGFESPPELRAGIPFDDGMRETFRYLLALDGPLFLGRDAPELEGMPRNHQVQGLLAVPFLPREDDPYVMGIHWCREAHVATDHERNLLRNIALRLQDVIAMRRLHGDLIASEDRYRQLFTNLSTAFCLLEGPADGGTHDLRVLEANAAFERLIGRPSSDLAGRLASEVLDDAELAWNGPAARALAGRSSGIEHRGAVSGRWYKIAAYAPRPGQVGLLFEDVTQERLAEADLQNANRLEAVGLLAGGIAHDFNNILTGILGNLSLARIDATGSEGLENLISGAERASLRARDLTNQLLTFAKGGEPIRRKTTTLEDLLRDSATFALSGSRSTCSFRIDGDLWPVEIDDTQISRVFQNLVINADQSMPGGGEIRVRASNHVEDGARGSLPPGRYLRIEVEDRGLGIPEEHLAHIFEPYFTTKTEGSGFGLPICYSIVRRHGGLITVRSEPGRGSTFGVFLPASVDTPAEAPARSPHAARLPGRFRVLVVDDEEMVRDFLVRALPTLGCEAEAVADGADAVARYRECRESARPFDVVLMDLTIAGGMGGLEATSHIRSLDPEARVIVSSGYSDDPVMAEHERFGFCGVLQKPYHVDRLSETLARALGPRP